MVVAPGKTTTNLLDFGISHCSSRTFALQWSNRGLDGHNIGAFVCAFADLCESAYKYFGAWANLVSHLVWGEVIMKVQILLLRPILKQTWEHGPDNVLQSTESRDANTSAPATVNPCKPRLLAITPVMVVRTGEQNNPYGGNR